MKLGNKFSLLIDNAKTKRRAKKAKKQRRKKIKKLLLSGLVLGVVISKRARPPRQ